MLEWVRCSRGVVVGAVVGTVVSSHYGKSAICRTLDNKSFYI